MNNTDLTETLEEAGLVKYEETKITFYEAVIVKKEALTKTKPPAFM